MALMVAGSAVSVFLSLGGGPEQRVFDPGTADPAPLGWAGDAAQLLRVPLRLWAAWLCRRVTSAGQLILVLAPAGLLGFLNNLSGTVSDLAGGRALDGSDAFSVAATLMFAVFAVGVVRQPPTTPS